MSTKPTNIHANITVADLLNSALNGEKHEIKKKCLERVGERFSHTAEFTKLSKELEANTYTAGEKRKCTTELQKLDEHQAALDAGKMTTAEVATLLKFDPPARGADRAITNKLKAEREELAARLKALEALNESRQALKKELDTLRRQFISEDKSSYSCWKSGMITDHRDEITTKDAEGKYSDVFEMLRAQLPSVSEDMRGAYEELITVDSVKPKCIRPSKSPKIILYLMEYATTEYFRQAQVTHGARYASIVTENRESGDEKAILPSTLTVSDLVNSNFNGSQFGFLLETEYLIRFRALGDVLVHSTELTDFLATANSKILSDVADYVKKQSIDSSKDLVQLVAALVTDLCNKLGAAAKNVLATHGSITTLKPEIFDNILQPYFIMRGQDYTPVREKLRALWSH